MSETPGQPLSDDDIVTGATGHQVPDPEHDADGVDQGQDADGTDSSDSDSSDSDSSDAVSGDADGTDVADGMDADGTDSSS